MLIVSTLHKVNKAHVWLYVHQYADFLKALHYSCSEFECTHYHVLDRLENEREMCALNSAAYGSILWQYDF